MPEPTSDAWLECLGCGARYDLGDRFTGCLACGSPTDRQPLEVRYPVRPIAPDPTQHGIWRWHTLLPPVPSHLRYTLREGNTPLLPLRTVWPFADGVDLLVKNETANPTWSWKDRPNSVSLSVARQFGFEQVVAKSTGNHGNSVSAYASLCGMASTVFCHRDAPDLQLALMQGYGARVVLGGDQDALIRQLIRRERYFPATILCPRAGYSNPYGVEGFKTIAFELCEELNWTAPDRVFVGVGSGDGIYGIWKGFRELFERGRIAHTPRMIACQAAGADSLVRGFNSGSRRIQPLPSAHTAALSVSEEVTGDHALQAVYDSQGSALSAGDDAIAEARRRFQRTGLALELASALAYLCAERMARQELRSLQAKPERWVVIGSGSAVKWPESLIDRYQRPEPLAAPVWSEA